MAVTGINIEQSNTFFVLNLLAINNPVVFLIDVDYTGDAPEVATVAISDESGALDTFNLVYYSDPEVGTRRFAFIADEILRGYMPDGGDFYQDTLNVLEYCPNATKEFTLNFICDTESESLDIVACHAAQQIGEQVFMEDVFNNVETTYFTGVGQHVYVYFYNWDETNTLELQPPEIEYLTDYDDYPFISVDNLFYTSE